MSAVGKLRIDGSPTRYWPTGAALKAEPESSPIPEAPRGWRRWLEALFSQYVRADFAKRHEDFWNHIWAIQRDDAPEPFIGLWPRGGGKSSSAELAACALGLRGRRRYIVYIRETQARADESVANIASMLESAGVQRYYPQHAERQVGLHGNIKGWRRNRLRTAGLLTIDALGLDVASRGVKVDEQRPDLFILDDIDGRHDTREASEKKLTTIKETILPAGSNNVAVIGIQNLIIPRGVFARLADGSADMLVDRILSGPEPAVRDLKTAPAIDPKNGETYQKIVAGTATWAGQDLDVCQRQIRLWGFSAFNREAQHNVADREGALWTQAIIDRYRVPKAPRLKRVVVAVDPSGGGTEIGIVAVGEGYDGHGYVLADNTQKGKLGARNWGRKAIDTYEETEADLIVGEGNFGGDMVKANILVSQKGVPVKLVHASRGKDIRAQPIATLYEEGKIHHVGTFPELEAELTGWVPGDDESPNRLDSDVWACTELFVKHSEGDEAPPSRTMRTF